MLDIEAEQDCSFYCPYCSALVTLKIDCTAGRRQEFTYDCETCCQPVEVCFQIDSMGMTTLSVEREA